MIPPLVQLLLGVLVLLAGGLTLVAAIGILRFPDALTRMHASSKVGAVAGSVALIAAAVDIGSFAAVTRALLGILFLLLTAPIGAHLLGRSASWRSGAAPPPAEAPPQDPAAR